MKATLKAQFGPGNPGWIARNTLMGLKHTSTLQTYIKTFIELMLEILDMDEDRLYHFMKGLQTWEQAELQRQNVQTPTDAIATTENLLDFKAGLEKT